jgi:hypothetical protein
MQNININKFLNIEFLYSDSFVLKRERERTVNAP